MKKILTVEKHYDLLIEQDNDPVNDLEPMKEYMNGWDGQEFLDLIKPTAGKDILEIGIGTGRVALKVLASGYNKFTGVDISGKTLERAKQHLSSYSNVTLIHEDFMTVVFNLKFDIIYSTLTFFHIEDKQNAMKKIHSLLKKNGKFVLSIEKETEEMFCFDEYGVKMYPDTTGSITKLLEFNGFHIMDKKETEKAFLFLALLNT